jgi:hypothetical protein
MTMGFNVASKRGASAHRARSVIAIILAVCPPIVCAWLAENSGR